MEDMQIITLFLARNEDAIRHTDDTYGRRLYHLADGILRSGQDAEESVSDTYLKAWNTIPPRRPQHLFAYLAKICRNFALKKVVWKNAQKRKAEVVTLTQEMENCIPDTYRDSAADARELGQLLVNELFFLLRDVKFDLNISLPDCHPPPPFSFKGLGFAQ